MISLLLSRRQNCLIAVLTLAAAACFPFLSSAEDKSAATTAKAALTVSTTLPSSADWPLRITANGSIAAWQEAIVGSEINGLRLTDVRVNVGDRVRKGQELAKLQSLTVEAEREQTRASLSEAEASLTEAQANASRARQIGNSGALSAQQVTQYLTAELTAKARLEVLKARLKSDDVRLSQTRITAPDDGTISARSATLGAVVQSGQELFRMIRQDRLEWRAELPAADLARIRPGMPVSLTTASKNKVAGHVRMVAPTLDPQTRNGLVYVDLNVKGVRAGGASSGMFARGEFEIGHGKVLTLPQSAVLLREGYSYVFRLGPDNRVVQTKVEVGQRSDDRVAVTSGLDAGIPVVNDGVGFLADGDLVRVVTPAK